MTPLDVAVVAIGVLLVLAATTAHHERRRARRQLALERLKSARHNARTAPHHSGHGAALTEGERPHSGAIPSPRGGNLS